MRTLHIQHPELEWLQQQSVPLQKSILNFYVFPWQEAHPSWLPSDIPSRLLKASRHPRVARAIQKLFVDQHLSELEGCMHFSRPEDRWVLLSRQRLETLAMQVGILMQKNFFFKIIHKEDRLEVQKQLGEELSQFAMHTAVRFPLPPALLVASPTRLTLDASLPGRILETAQVVFEQLYAHYPNNFLKRLCLKLPRSLHWDFDILSDPLIRIEWHHLLLNISTRHTQTEPS